MERVRRRLSAHIGNGRGDTSLRSAVVSPFFGFAFCYHCHRVPMAVAIILGRALTVTCGWPALGGRNSGRKVATSRTGSRSIRARTRSGSRAKSDRSSADSHRSTGPVDAEPALRAASAAPTGCAPSCAAGSARGGAKRSPPSSDNGSTSSEMSPISPAGPTSVSNLSSFVSDPSARANPAARSSWTMTG